MKNMIYFSLIVFSSLTLSQCGDDPMTNECTGVVATYDGIVGDFLTASCAFVGCHDQTTRSGGVDFSNYAPAKAYLDRSNNKFLCGINHSSGCSPMPQGAAKLDDTTIKIFTCWYNNGYLKN
ncbi:MAG: hypothetical protein ABIO44_02275 [Saprospiraceae bacterium]